MEIESGLLQVPNLVLNAEIVKTLVIERMIAEKLISQSQGEAFCQKWNIVVFRRKWYRRWWDKVFNPAEYTDKEGNQYSYMLVPFEDLNLIK